MRPHIYEYIVYRGDEVICSGTKNEVLEKMNMTRGTFDRIANSTTEIEEAQAYRKKGYSKRMVAVKVSIAEIKKELGLAQ